MREQRLSTLEVVMRIRSPHGRVEAEYTVRGSRVELASYYPSGEHAARPVVVPLDRFIELLRELRELRERA